jgi:hypothetical protein
VQWFVNEGDLVEEFTRVCEVQSDKATIEITSPYAGKLAFCLQWTLWINLLPSQHPGVRMNPAMAFSLQLPCCRKGTQAAP